MLLGRWLLAESEVLLLYDITRGVDVGTKHDIYELMTELVREGKSLALLLERDRGDRAALPSRARHARRARRGRARRATATDAEAIVAAAVREHARVTTLATPATPYRSRSRLQHLTIQSAPLLLALIILAGMTALYVGLFYPPALALPRASSSGRRS